MLGGKRTDSLRGTALILAAGASVRFGSDKKDIPFANKTLLQHTVELYCTVFRKVLVVVRAPINKKVTSFPENVETVIATDARHGLSQSLRAGIVHAQKDPWIVVGLMDMPYVNVRTLENLAARMESTTAAIVRLRFKEQYGNPVGFKQECYSQLCELTGDQGARTLFHTGKFRVETLEVDDRGILIDIDTPEQLNEYRSSDS
ncbi:MAG: nucleotidyltransferase family protein [Gammaproteobacteria bacterium]|nr:nucleotidyltransferase family protein [Gammaproteobacteria bacterium]